MLGCLSQPAEHRLGSTKSEEQSSMARLYMARLPLHLERLFLPVFHAAIAPMQAQAQPMPAG